MKADFLYIGPDKSGSSWLAKLFESSEDVFVPPAKDLYFFDRYYDKGLGWYEKFFANAIPGQLCGEICHDYLFSRKAAERIRNYNSNIRLFCSLRDPVERSFSQYLYIVRSGLIKLPFEEAIRELPRILENSLYGKHLDEYFSLFSRKQVGVFFFEDLVNNPEFYADAICDFLGIEMIRPLPGPERSSALARNAKIAFIIKKFATVARGIGLANLVGRVKSGKIQNLFYRPFGPDEKPVLAEATRSYLIDYFSEDTQKLRKILGVEKLPYEI